MANKRLFVWSVIVVLMCFCMTVFVVQIPSITYAADLVNSFDNSDVLEDLRSSTVNGENFSLSDYSYSQLKDLKVINFVEYGYSIRVNQTSQYGLYIYIYNPKNINIVTNSNQNKIQMAVEYDASGNIKRYEKFELQFCSKSEETNYKNLFYKFKIVDKKVNGKYFFERVNSNERRYDISGVELLTYGNRNATEYNVGGTYKFTGFAKGMGPDINAESTLTSVVTDLETLELEVHHTYFRTNVSSLGKGHYNQVSTVYFSVPDRIYQEYGSLQKIRAEWWEYKTKLGAVTSNATAYQELLQGVDKVIPYNEKNTDIPTSMYYGGEVSSTSGGTHSYTSSHYDWSYNIKTNYDDGTNIGIASSTHHYESDSQSLMIPFAFYSEAPVSLDNVFSLIYSKPIAGDVDSSSIAEWIYNYSNDLGNGYIDCNGRNISKDLFDDSVDNGRTKGYNDKTIDFGDTFNLESYDSNHNWWDKLFDYGFSWPKTNGDYYNIQPIYELKASDLIEINSDISSRLLINENDVQDIQAYYAAESIKGNHVILFRFASTDYFSMPVSRLSTSSIVHEDEADTYVAQETVFLDFDIIELTFNKDGTYYVIPAVSSPSDIIGGFTAPAQELEWWKLVLGVVLLLLLLVILAPILPYIFKGIVWLISTPIKVIKELRKNSKNKVENGGENDDVQDKKSGNK